MPVQLKDAKITVKIDLEESKKEIDSVEKRTKREREDRKKDERREKTGKTKGKTGKVGRNYGIGPAMAGNVLANGIRQIVTAGASLPGAELIFTSAIAGMGVGEIWDKFGPLMDAFADEMLPGKLENAMILLGVNVPAIKAIGEVWIDIKTMLQSFQQGISGAGQRAWATALTGEDPDPSTFFEMFKQERGMAEHLIWLERMKRHRRQRVIGKAGGKALKAEVGKVFEKLAKSAWP